MSAAKFPGRADVSLYSYIMDAVWMVNLMLMPHQLFLSTLFTVINVQAALVSITSRHFHYVILSVLPFHVPLQTSPP